MIWAGLLLAVAVGCIYWGGVGVVLDRQGRVPERGGVPGTGGGRTNGSSRTSAVTAPPKSPTAGHCLSKLVSE